MITQTQQFTVPEAAAFAQLSENQVNKEIEYRIIETDTPSRLSFSALVYLHLVRRSPLSLRARERSAIYKRIDQTLAQNEIPEQIEVVDPFYLRLGDKVTDLSDKVSRFLEWKKQLRSDPDVMGGTTTFPNTRLTVRHIGGMLERKAFSEKIVTEILEDYPYLDIQDLEFAHLFVRAYPNIDQLDDNQ